MKQNSVGEPKVNSNQKSKSNQFLKLVLNVKKLLSGESSASGETGESGKGDIASESVVGGDVKIVYHLLFLIMVIEILQLFFSLSLKWIFDDLADHVPYGTQHFTVLIPIAAMVSVKVLHVLFDQFVFDKKIKNFLVHIENTWPLKAQAHLLSLPPSFHSSQNTAQKADAIHQGCVAIGEFIEKFVRSLALSGVFLATHLIVMFYLEYHLAILFFLPMIPIIHFYLNIHLEILPKWEAWHALRHRATTLFYQSLSHIRTVQICQQEENEKAKLSVLHKDMATIENEIYDELRKNKLIAHGVMALTYAITLAYGALLVQANRTTVGTLVFFVSLATGAIQQLWQLSSSYMDSFKSLIAIKNLSDYFSEKPPHEVGLRTPSIPLDVELENMSFQYPGKTSPVFKNVNLKFSGNKMIAFVGKSGEGKSTLLRILRKVLCPIEGCVRVNGVSLDQLDTRVFQKQFAVVDQDVEIFDTTLLENIRYSEPNSSQDQIEKALAMAHLLDAVSDGKRFPLGLQSYVGERGHLLSGGERQRVGIARAILSILNGAHVLLLDEATSQLDSETEGLVVNMIDQLKTQITVLAVAHRQTTIARADEVYEIQGHKIIRCI